MLFGVDGLDWTVLRRTVASGAAPHFSALLEGAAWAEVPVKPCIPGLGGAEGGMNSPTLWTTIASGQYYFQHGVYDFCNLLDAREDPPLFESRHVRGPRIWDVLTTRGRRSLVAGYYVTHPAYEIDGVMISDLFGDVADPAVAWPPALADELARDSGAADYAGYVAAFGAMSRETGEGGALRDAPGQPGAAAVAREALERFARLSAPQCDALLRDPGAERDRKLIEYRLVYPFERDRRLHRSFLRLLEVEPFEFATIYYRLLDFAGHGFWTEGLPLPPAFVQTYGAVIDEAYAWIDARLGEVRAALDADDRLIVLSDHGFEANPDATGWDADAAISAVSYGRHAEPAVMIVHGGARCGRIDDVSLLDVAPSIYDYFGVEQAEALDGGPIPGLLHAGAPRPAPRVSHYAYRTPQAAARMSEQEEREVKARLAALGYLEQT